MGKNGLLEYHRSLAVLTSLSPCFYELADSLQRNPHPLRAVMELIAQLVEGLFQEVDLQQDLAFISGQRQSRGLADGHEIAGEKDGRDSLPPPPSRDSVGEKVGVSGKAVN
jgi:hypothetical protein